MSRIPERLQLAAILLAGRLPGSRSAYAQLADDALEMADILIAKHERSPQAQDCSCEYVPGDEPNCRKCHPKKD